MPLVSNESESQYWEPMARGPVAQLDLTARLPATVAATGNFTALYNGDGYGQITLGLTSSQAGLVTIQRYLDIAGTILNPSAAFTPVAIVVATPLIVNVGQTAVDNLAYRSFKIIITNSSGTIANLTAVALVLLAQ